LKVCDFDQVAELISAMTFIGDAGGDMHRNDAYDCHSARKWRLRPTVIAV